MRKIFYFAVLFVLFSSFTAQASHDVSACRELEDLADRLVAKMNSFFNMSIKSEFITKANDGSSSDEVGAPLTLMDANSAHATLQIPKPCLMTEDSLPSKELWSLIIAHEYSHKIIDQRQDQCFQAFIKNQPLASAKVLERDQMHHANMDVLSLKILSQTNVNTNKSIADLQKYIKQNQGGIGNDTTDAFKKRIQYMKKIMPVDIESSAGFLFGEYFDGFDQMDNFIRKQHPKSTLVKDLKSGVTKVDGCFIVKPTMAQQSLNLWRSLDSTSKKSLTDSEKSKSLIQLQRSTK